MLNNPILFRCLGVTSFVFGLIGWAVKYDDWNFLLVNGMICQLFAEMIELKRKQEAEE